MLNMGQNQIFTNLCEENDFEVDHASSDKPTLNIIVHRGFVIRSKTSNTLMHNSELELNVKNNKKIVEKKQ